MATESYSSFDTLMQYYGNSTALGAHVPFNFGLLRSNRKNMIEDIDHYISMWLNAMPENSIPNWVVRYYNILI